MRCGGHLPCRLAYYDRNPKKNKETAYIENVFLLSVFNPILFPPILNLNHITIQSRRSTKTAMSTRDSAPSDLKEAENPTKQNLPAGEKWEGNECVIIFALP